MIVSMAPDCKVAFVDVSFMSESRRGVSEFNQVQAEAVASILEVTNAGYPATPPNQIVVLRRT